MLMCPQCRTAYPAQGAVTCLRDGTQLVDAKELARSDADPLIGTTVAGRFKIAERIGSGGMGTVYRAAQAGLARNVALKILKKELNWETDTVTRFQREAKAMSLLTHANTVRVFDFGQTEDERLFFAMELLEGELLTSHVKSAGMLDPENAVRIGQQILGSLHEAHSKGIIHRDLKPDNIYLALTEGHEEPVVKVLDFGIAKLVEGDRKIDQLETQAGTVFGTPRYMAPEQAQGKTLDARSDLYSVGVLLYHMLTGAPPFKDDDAVVVMAKHIREKPVPLSVAAPGQPIPPSLERLVLRAMAKQPKKRPRDAQVFARELQACVLDIHATVAERSSTSRRLAAAVAGRRAPAVLAALVALGALVIGVRALVDADAATAGTMDLAAEPAAIARGPMEAPNLDSSTQITIATNPAGAAIWFEGSKLGTTPLSVRRPPGSVMTVELRKRGFETVRADVIAGTEEPPIGLQPVPVEEPVARTTPETHSEGGRSASAEEPRRSRSGRRRARRRRARARMAAAAQAMAPTMTPTMVRSPSMDRPYERW